MTRRSARVALAAILLLATLLRTFCFVGLVSGDPQDDGIYYNQAFSLYSEGRSHLEIFRNPPPDWLPNPIDQFHVRPMVTYPIAAAFFVLGPGERTAALWALACSLITVVVVFRLGLLAHDRSVGLIAALLCAFYPLEVINATRILSDVQVAMFFAAGLLLVAEGGRRQSGIAYALVGVAAGGAYLANARGLIVLLLLVGAAGLQWLSSRPRGMWQAPVLVLAGFGAVFAVEATVYYVKAGDPLLSYHIQAGAARFKYLYEPVTSLDWGWIQVSYTNGEPLDLLRSVLGMTNRPNQFGLFFFLFFAAAVFSIVKRRNLLLVALTIAFCLYLEFGPVQVSVDWGGRKLHYMMVFKQDRFLLALTPPFLVLSGYLIRAIARASLIAALTVLALLAATSTTAIKETREFYRAGLNDIRTISPDVTSNSDVTFVGDHWAIEHLRIFARHEAKNLRVISPTAVPAELKGTCVILGGSRGVELLADYVEATLPPFARDVLSTGNAPASWVLRQHVEGPATPQRLHDLRVYCVQ